LRKVWSLAIQALVPQGVARRGCNAADDDVADFAFGVD
jgi:hypothetical protein